MITDNHLLQHKKWHEYRLYNGTNNMPMPSHFKCHGKLGTGKIFVNVTMHNITRKQMKYNIFDATSAPTEFAANLSHSVTHNRLYKIPIGKKSHTSGLECYKGFNVEEMYFDMEEVFLLIVDEDSMAGQYMGSWFENKSE